MMDFGTTVVAGGKMELALRDNKPVPATWLRDKAGRPSTDPRDFFAGGTIPPLGGDAETGGYKGYALAVMVDVLSGVLSGTGYGAMLTLQTQGVFLGAWQVEAFLPLGDFRSMLDRRSRLGETPPADGHDRVLTPGEREWSAGGAEPPRIPLHPTVVEELRGVGTELGVRFPSAVPVSA
jgi:LDH2 family malate/lactate/ureidoglycolate dehydrogenase